jgi:hypothetical protein
MTQLYRSFKKYHKWLGVFLAIFFVFFALSGIVLNHRGFFSSVDVGRGWLPADYHYSNWNNASIRGSVQIENDSILVYGNIGVWLTNRNYSEFIDFNKGFEKGIDNRKISDLHKTQTNQLFASTLFGLFKFSENKWQKVQLPVKEERMVAITERGDSLIVMSRSHILYSLGKENYSEFNVLPLKTPIGAENSVSLFKTIWVIHSGEILGSIGKIIVDFGGVALILLSVTGLIYFFAPKLLRKIQLSLKLRRNIKRTNRWSFKWHLKVGIIAALLLFIVSITGIFLRPPLLIPIANKVVKPIKGSYLDNPNYWHDRLRDIIYDSRINAFVISTSEGFFSVNENFEIPPQRFSIQPPVSVMGINAFDIDENGNYIVGSFSGLYSWNLSNRFLSDYITGLPIVATSGLQSPFGSMPIAGQISFSDGSKEFFDYNIGAIGFSKTHRLPQMPNEIIEKSGISLWNLALEFHTWRIAKFLIGDFYILIVPIAGLLCIVIIFTGSVMWFIRQRRKKYNLITEVDSDNEIKIGNVG